jgi:hypothetical protein
MPSKENGARTARPNAAPTEEPRPKAGYPNDCELGPGAKAPDLTLAVRFLTEWFAPDTLLQVCAIVPDGPATARTFEPRQEADALHQFLATHLERANLYFGVNPVRTRLSKKATKAEVAALAYLHVDCDPRPGQELPSERERILTTLRRAEPHTIVDSGNGYQAFWRLAEPLPTDGADLTALEAHNKHVAALVDGDEVSNLDRLMRIPGTLNLPGRTKQAAGRVKTVSALVHHDTDLRHVLAPDDVLPPRFRALLDTDPKLRRRWEGSTEGLTDTSRSALDYSMVALLKARRFSADEITSIVAAYPHGAAGDKDTRYTARMLERAASGLKPTQADRLLALLHEAELWHTPERRSFLTLGGEDYPVNSLEVRRLLVHRYEQRYGTAPGGDAVTAARAVLDAKAVIEGPEYPVYVRVAEHAGAILIDLGTPDRTAVTITADGWTLGDQPPVRFLRPPGLRPLPRPVAGGSVELLRPFVNLRPVDPTENPHDADWRLLVAWLLAALRPVGPYPLLGVEAEQGGGKTTLTRIVRALIDPASAGVRAAPKNEQDLVIAASNSHVLALDNLSYVRDWLSDALCRLSTGGGLGTRELYSDANEVLFDVRRPVVLNGITELAARGDLRDRIVALDLPPIPEARRRDERRFWRDFEAACPAILGALYSAVSGALRLLPTTTLEHAPRMADFALWATAAEPGLGWPAGSFLASYATNRADAVHRAVQHDALASVVVALLHDSGDRAGTPTKILEVLTDQAGRELSHSHDWPKTPRELGRCLRRAAPDLLKVGVGVDFGRGTERTISLRLVGREPVPSLVAEDGTF